MLLPLFLVNFLSSFVEGVPYSGLNPKKNCFCFWLIFLVGNALHSFLLSSTVKQIFSKAFCLIYQSNIFSVVALLKLPLKKYSQQFVCLSYLKKIVAIAFLLNLTKQKYCFLCGQGGARGLPDTQGQQDQDLEQEEEEGEQEGGGGDEEARRRELEQCTV